MHGDIIRYSMDGEIADRNVTQERERLIEFLETQMRDYGCVPSLDLHPLFTLDYNQDTETYQFSLSVYGVFVGSEEAWTGAGMTNGKMISRYIRPIRSKAS